MKTYLTGMFFRGNINMSAQLVGVNGSYRVADSHYFLNDTLPQDARMHLNVGDSYAAIHWVIRHEAAHLHFGGSYTEAQADSVANACGPDGRPW
jgi:hypothetical protein